MKNKLTIMSVLLGVSIFYFCISWFSYSGGTWEDSKNDLQFTYVKRANYNSQIGAVIYPSYSELGLQKESIKIGNGNILFKGEKIEFTRNEKCAIISHDETINFVDISSKYLLVDEISGHQTLDIEELKKDGVWFTKIKPLLEIKQR